MKHDKKYHVPSECEKCKTLSDCPWPDVSMDGMANPLPPDVCPKPIEVMRETLKKRKHK